MPILERYRRMPSGPSGLRTLLLLVALLVGLFAAMLSLGGSGDRIEPANRAARAPAGHPVAGTPVENVAPETPIAPAPWQELSEAEELRLLARNVVDQRSLGVREQSRAYYYMLGKVHHMSAEDMAYRLDPEAGYRDFARRPGIMRGTAVELAGSVIRLQRVAFREPGSPVPVIWEGHGIAREGRPVFFVLTEPPQKPFHPDRISVRDPEYAVLRGLFFQNVLYANAQDEWVAAPMIIGRSLRARPGAGPRDENRVWVWLGVAGAALVVLGLRLVYLYRSLRRRPARRVRPWPEEPDADAPPLPGEAQIDAHRDTDADEPSSGEP